MNWSRTGMSIPNVSAATVPLARMTEVSDAYQSNRAGAEGMVPAFG